MLMLYIKYIKPYKVSIVHTTDPGKVIYKVAYQGKIILVSKEALKLT